MESQRLSDVVEVDVPQLELVELQSVQTRSKQPLIIGCQVNQLRAARILHSLPGLRPKESDETEEEKPKDESGADPELDLDRLDEDMETFEPLAQQLIEKAGTYLLKDGQEITPAFWFTSDPGNGALPGRILGAVDQVNIAKTLMRQGGFLGGAAADEAAFPVRGRSGRPDGVGAVAPGADTDPAEPSSADEADAGASAGV